MMLSPLKPVSLLVLLSVSNGFEICTRKALFSDSTTLLTCGGKCCGLTAYVKYCCSSSLQDTVRNSITKTGSAIDDTFNGRDSVDHSTSSSSNSGVEINWSTFLIIGISVGSVAFIALVVGIIACVACSRKSSRPGHVISHQQPPMASVSTGHTNFAHSSPTYPVPPGQA